MTVTRHAGIGSQMTLRRIFIGVGIATLSVILVVFLWLEVEAHWLTSSERNAAKAALAEIDLLQNSESMDGKQFDLQEERANLKLGTAREMVRTRRDRELEAVLSYYFTLTISPWDKARFVLESSAPSSDVDADRKLERKRWIAEAAEREQLRTVLHKELD